MAHTFLILVAFSFFNLLPSNESSGVVAENPITVIKSTCYRTINYNLCLSTLKSLPPTNSTDPLSLAQMMIQKARAQGIANLAQIQNLLFNETDGVVLDYLNYCLCVYGDALFIWLKTSFDESKSNNLVGASAHSILAAQRVLHCDKRFGDQNQPRKSPISDGNSSFKDLAQIAGNIFLALSKKKFV